MSTDTTKSLFTQLEAHGFVWSDWLMDKAWVKPLDAQKPGATLSCSPDLFDEMTLCLWFDDNLVAEVRAEPDTERKVLDMVARAWVFHRGPAIWEALTHKQILQVSRAPAARRGAPPVR